ncbi:probable NADPH quinone oxidoreductase homolog PIG3 [Cephalotrichum gorgonifer]|uniref:Probable NADPH quinone oxidoreductase homolog PIG3 n=1 Tax=Cephalotrichum gorgonifer TaxID=2041049 RepID=A0AAE8MPZ0_9PEZI|nr:probable NADPH quinone oxidoreductase homolog PIG3 [Cephalotrichum gorgonifer]
MSASLKVEFVSVSTVMGKAQRILTLTTIHYPSTIDMKAIDIKGGTGPREALFLNPDVPTPVPAEGQALVKIRAFGINRMDIIQRHGKYALPPQAPKTLGVEFSGVIDSFGPGAEADHGFAVGDEVFGLAYGGAYAEYLSVSTRMLVKKPASMSWEVAASIPESLTLPFPPRHHLYGELNPAEEYNKPRLTRKKQAWITALQALTVVGEFSRGKSVLWHAGASGVSLAGIQLSRLLGASEIYATAGSDEKCAYLTRDLGVTAAFNYRTTPDWSGEILARTGGRGVDVVVDFVGKDYLQKNIDVAARDGRVVLLGLLSGPVVEAGLNISGLLYKRLRIEGSTLRSRDVEYQGRLRDELERYVPEFETGKLRAIVDTVLPWEEIQKAHQLMEENKNKGKIVCTIS